MANFKSQDNFGRNRIDCEFSQASGHNCCQDSTFEQEGSDQLSFSKLFFDFDKSNCPNILVFQPSILLDPSVDYESNKYYTPPPIERDILVLVQSFLI